MSERPPAAKVLIVDDASDVIMMLSDALTIEGLDTLSARDGREAVALTHSERPDIVLMDAQMPGMDGFHACEIIKSSPGNEDLPIIFMTGYNESEHVMRGFASGGVDFIAKPIQLDQLVARIKVHLTTARRSRSARHALDATGRPLLACDPFGRIQWATTQAAHILQRLGTRSDRGSFLPTEIITWLTGSIEAGVGITVERGGGSIEFRLLGNSEGETLLRLIDRQLGNDEELLATAYGLTQREAEVLLWVAHGKANKEIAEILDIAPRTVNKHLEQIFTKLAVEKRTAAATKAVKVLWRE